MTDVKVAKTKPIRNMKENESHLDQVLKEMFKQLFKVLFYLLGTRMKMILGGKQRTTTQFCKMENGEISSKMI